MMIREMVKEVVSEVVVFARGLASRESKLTQVDYGRDMTCVAPRHDVARL
jgi:hypothetical protein